MTRPRAHELLERGTRTAAQRVTDAADRRRLQNGSFSIISSDCWGAEVYRALKLPYRTPFVGLMLHGPCYVALVSDLRARLSESLVFTQETRYPENAEWRRSNNLKYPIGIISPGIEIHFIHEESAQAAAGKWDRRVDRIDWDNLYFKLSGDKDFVTTEELREFDRLPYERKVAFTRSPHPDLGSVVPIRRYSLDGAAMYRRAQAEFDVVDWLNGGDGRVHGVRKAARLYRSW